MASTEKSFTESGSSVTYGATAAAYRYKYDENNRLIQLTHTVNGTTWSTGYTYDSDGRQQQITLSNGKTIEYAYGATTGRPDYITLNLDSDYVVDWTYKSGANGSTTALISTYTNGSDARYNYNYDANGNITQIWRGSVTFANASEKYSYVYDAANQLIRENLYYGIGNSNNATITYQYDSWGNLLYKRTYAYTTGTLGTVQETVTYTYGNSSWKDQLTSYNGQRITYDASGNPTSYLGAALVWEGQRLKSYTPASTGSGRVNAYTYNYDENGIRTRKTVGNTVTDYYYNGSLLMGMTVGAGSTAKVMLFSYDAGGNVIAVDYSENNGSSFTTYYYLRNAQNDVVKLIDGSGNAVIQYTYDSWGKLLSTTGSLAETFGAEQPFRYRGYVYDEETGWYYLQSRYYNPEVGRFISADVYLSTGQGVLGHNAYAYCLNNPVNRFDSDGYISLKGLLEFLRQLCEGIGGPRWNLPSNSSSPLSNSSSAVVAQGQQAYGPDVSVDESSRSNHRNEMRNSRSSIAEESDGVCFIAGTLILTEKDEVQIEDIETGDYVYATDPETGESSYKRVVQTFERETDEIVKVTYGGETITTTPTHPFYVPQRGWTEAIKLRAGDILVKNNGEYVVVEKVQHEILETPVIVYNFEVEDYHTYYVAASADSDVFVLVHNSCRLPKNGTTVSSSDALDMADDFLGSGYIELSPGRFVSADGLRQVRMKPDDLMGTHGGGPHINFDILLPKYKTSHIFFID